MPSSSFPEPAAGRRNILGIILGIIPGIILGIILGSEA